MLGMRCEHRGAKNCGGETLRCCAPSAATWGLFAGSQGFGSGCCEAVGLSLTSQLAEGGDESAGEGLQLVVRQGDAVDPLGDAPHGFVDADWEGHQLAVGQICPRRDPGTLQRTPAGKEQCLPSSFLPLNARFSCLGAATHGCH